MKKTSFLPLLFAIMFFVMSGFGIIIPVLPFLAEELGATPTQLGMLMATYSLMQLLFAPFWGQMSDRYGRKPILFIGISGLSLSFFLFAVAKTLTMLFIARIIGGMLSAATMPTAMAYVADVTTPQERGKAMGAIGAATGLGFIFGPAIGGIFSKTNLQTPFFISGTLSAATACLVLLFLKESWTKEKQSATLKTKESIWYILKGPLLFLYLLQWIVTFSLAGLEATFAYYAAKRAELYSAQLGYIFMIMGLASAIVQGGLIGKLVRKFGEGRVIQGGIVVSAIGFTLILFIHNFLTAAIFLSIFGIGNSVIRPCVSSLVTKHISSGQGRATGLLSSFDSLGRIVGPPIAGQLFATMIELPYLAGIILSIFALALYHVFTKKLKQSQQALS
jgi:MFS transporter, DHA1 family, multidrug resistance protein